MARLYRLHPDSSYLRSPRVFARVFCEVGTLPATVRFYEGLTSVALDMDMDIPEAGLHVVAVGPFLILEMDMETLERAGQAAQTQVTVLNAHLDEAVARQVAAGARIVQQRWEAPPGPGVRLRHPDGLLVEYLEHRPSADDVEQPGHVFRRARCVPLALRRCSRSRRTGSPGSSRARARSRRRHPRHGQRLAGLGGTTTATKCGSAVVSRAVLRHDRRRWSTTGHRADPEPLTARVCDRAR